MSAQNITEVVKEKYGQAALRVAGGGNSLLWGGSVDERLRRPDHQQFV